MQSVKPAPAIVPAAEERPDPPFTTDEGCPTPLAWQDVREAIRREGRSHEVESGPVKIAATSIGTGPPLYLLPGFLGDHELSTLTAWLLKEQRTCLMFDPLAPVTSESDPGTIFSAWTDGVIRFAAGMGHSEIHLHGPNLGGQVALNVLITGPERFASASLQCGFARWKLSPFERLLIGAGRRTQRAFGTIPGAMRVQLQNHRRWFPPFDHTRWDFYAGNVATTPTADCAARARIAAAVDLRPQLSRIPLPVLVITGEGDPLMNAYAEELMGALSNARREVIDNSGRLAHVTHPHRLVKLLRSFWDEAS